MQNIRAWYGYFYAPFSPANNGYIFYERAYMFIQRYVAVCTHFNYGPTNVIRIVVGVVNKDH